MRGPYGDRESKHGDTYTLRVAWAAKGLCKPYPLFTNPFGRPARARGAPATSVHHTPRTDRDQHGKVPIHGRRHGDGAFAARSSPECDADLVALIVDCDTCRDDRLAGPRWAAITPDVHDRSFRVWLLTALPGDSPGSRRFRTSSTLVGTPLGFPWT